MITQRHIAERLGISRQLVGHALRGHGGVAEATRKRIEQAARDMGYHRESNWAARVMLARRHDRPGSVAHAEEVHPEKIAAPPVWLIARKPSKSTDEARWLFADYLNGLLEAFSAWKCGFELICPLADKTDLDIVRDIVETGRASAIVNLLLQREATEYLIQKRYPMVMVNEDQSRQGVPSVIADHVGGFAEACRAAAELGHRHLAFFGYDTLEFGSLNFQPRLEECIAGARAAGMELRPEQIIHAPPDPTGEAIWDAFVRECGSDTKRWPTWVFAQNDVRAIRLISALQDHGVRVPEDISVVGFDDVPIAKHSHPALSTLSKPRFQMALVAAQLLRDVLAKRPEEGFRPQVLPVKFVGRNSHGIPSRR